MSLNQQQLKFFADYIYKELGIVYAEHNYFQLDQRLEKVAQHNNFKSQIELYNYCISNSIAGALKQYILDIATNNETSFYRDQKLYTLVESELLKNFNQFFPEEKKIKIWSAACSFGQEPYSIAMLIDKMKNNGTNLLDVEINASDISESALEKARSGIYSQIEVQRGLPIDYLVKYFSKIDEMNWQLNDSIKSKVKFKKQNLLDPIPHINYFHIVFIRNVLIYQETERKKEIVSKILKTIVPGGFIIFGSSESGLGLSNDIEQFSKDGAIVYRKK